MGTSPGIRFEGFDDDWESEKFGNLVTRRSSVSDKSTLPRVEFEDITSGEGRLNKELSNRKSTKAGIEFQNGDILYGKLRPYLKNWLHANFSGIAVGDFWVLEADQTNDSFIYSLIQSEKFQKITSITSGSKMPRADWGVTSKAEFHVPTRDEQEAIGGYFHNLDELIRLEEVGLTKLRNLKSTMLVKMFPQAGRTVPEIRFEGFGDAWEEDTLGGISSIKTGPFGSMLHAEDYVTVGTPIITTEHFKNWHLTSYRADLPQVSTVDEARLATYSLQAGDLVFSRVGSVDINAVVRSEHEGWLFSGRVLRVRLDEGDSNFMHVNLKNPGVREDILMRAVGQTMPSINTCILADTRVMLPCPAEQEAIGSYFHNLAKLIMLGESKLTKLKNLKSALLDKMFV